MLTQQHTDNNLPITSKAPTFPPPPATIMLRLLLLLLLAATDAGHAIPHDALALLAFKSAADLDHRLRFPLHIPHCLWPGVQCSNSSGRVVFLVLQGLRLRGQLPNASLPRLDQLRVLSLSDNNLSGPLPDLSPLLNLKSLFLSNNSLAGPFPASLLRLPRLRTLDLSRNALSGNLPSGLAALPRLSALRLELNRFSGAVPAFNQSSLRALNLSGNSLSGPVPATPALLRLGAAALSANPGLCGEVVDKPCQTHIPFFSSGAAASFPPPPASASSQLQGILISPPSPKRHRHAAAIAGFAAAVVLVATVLIGFSLIIKRKQRKGIPRVSSPTAATSAMLSPPPPHEFRGGELLLPATPHAPPEKGNAARNAERIEAVKSGSLVFCAGAAPAYSLEHLMRASAEMLGRGTMGTTYKAVMEGQLIMGVKRLDGGLMATVGRETFERHMGAVGNLRHPNLVPLRAFFQAKEERLLVYDYQPNGSVHSLIHGSKSTRAKPLHWTSCLKIAEDVAQGLAYIHQASRLVHGNIKSSNVLLGADFEACLADYCLALLVDLPDDETAYRAPETRKTNRRATSKSDVYSFGVLLLELLTGRPPLQQPFMNASDLPTWVRSVREDEEREESRLLMLIDIAIACTQPSQEQRPAAWQILKMIQEIKEAEIGDEMGSSGCHDGSFQMKRGASPPTGSSRTNGLFHLAGRTR